MINLVLKIIACICIIFLSPFILISAFLIMIEDGMPILFIQDRLGKDMKEFKIYKIRTMFRDAPNKGTHEVSKSNYLKTGSMLRKLKIDELPQILNYIAGDLNLIGPRPGLPSQHELKTNRIKYKVFDITPGISGLAQVLGYDMSDPVKLSKVDSVYIKNRSAKLDLIIFISTFIKIFRPYLAKRFRNEIRNINLGKENV